MFMFKDEKYGNKNANITEKNLVMLSFRSNIIFKKP